MYNISAIYYNPTFINCYAIVTDCRKTEKKREILSVSLDPDSPTGVSQWGHGTPGIHLGQSIPFCLLPPHIQRHVLLRLKENGQDSAAVEPPEPTDPPSPSYFTKQLEGV